MTVARHSEAAFETVIETHLLASGYTSVAPEGFDRERAIFPDTVLGFIRETQPKEPADRPVRSTSLLSRSRAPNTHATGALFARRKESTWYPHD